ncbi:MFS transporter [Baekduia soli]|uniref:MFS transporter n=1 Tax=Baekduia soli TaxID=496014 RepID=A0A5B8U5H2_9ACTN|nr:MFS transporter [Baekduia soli]QEC48237.1 MFS transporter [Baekduia soli]
MPDRTDTPTAARERRSGEASPNRPARGKRPIDRAEWRTLSLLAVPSLVLALATTVVTTYLPVHLRAARTSTLIIGLLIGTEGLMAIAVPMVAGPWSDRLRTRMGGRLPFVAAAILPLASSLIVLGLVGRLWITAAVLVVFFGAYFAAYEPYRALYPDLVDQAIAGRAQSTQALARGLGTFLALVGGGLLIAVADPVPFATASLLCTVGLGGFVVVAMRRRPADRGSSPVGGVRRQAAHVWQIACERRQLRLFLAANALWELSLGALKTFIVLYLTAGLGKRLSTASLIIGGVALLLLVASPISGTLGDRYGPPRVLTWALVAYGVGLLVPLLSTSAAVVAAATPVIAIGGGVVMTLPYAVLTPLMPDDEHGTLTGFYSVSRGIGTALGPLLAGAAIDLTSGLFDATQGYQATWGICSAAILLSLLPLSALRRTADDDPGPT